MRLHFFNTATASRQIKHSTVTTTLLENTFQISIFRKLQTRFG